MENWKVEKNNYSKNELSYVDMIINILPENKMSSGQKAVFMILYNDYLKHSSEETREDIRNVSRMFRQNFYTDIEEMGKISALVNEIDRIYNDYFLRIIFGKMENRMKLFSILTEHIRVISGYYDSLDKSYNYEVSGRSNRM